MVVRIRSEMPVEVPCMCTSCFAHWISYALMYSDLSEPSFLEISHDDKNVVKIKDGVYKHICGGDIAIIDKSMLPIVSTLNKKGYRTNFCCEGHAHDDGLELPYISFKDSVPASIFMNLPGLWRVDIDADIQCFKRLCNNEGPVIYHNDGHDFPDISDEDSVAILNWDEEALKKWADDLPDISIKTGSRCKLDYSDDSFNSIFKATYNTDYYTTGGQLLLEDLVTMDETSEKQEEEKCSTQTNTESFF